MSFLTKVFVVLLVITSLLTASAAVVYVNKEQFSDLDRTQLTAARDQAKNDVSRAVSDANTLRGRLAGAITASDSALHAMKLEADKHTADIASLQAANQQLLAINQTQEANVTAMATQLDIAQKSQGASLATAERWRDALDQATKSNAETETALADQRQRADTLARRVEFLNEQIKKQDDRLAADEAALKRGNISIPAEAGYSMGPTGSAGGTAVAPVSASPINGSVVSQNLINGIPYLTISVGSNENVQTGMEFSVIDGNSNPKQFLGVLKIIKADTSTSMGRFEKDSTTHGQVAAGNLVTTHLQ